MSSGLCRSQSLDFINGNECEAQNYTLRANINEIEQVAFITFPALQQTSFQDFSLSQCEELLKFLLLSGERISQMTRTYHDLEAVTTLLEEREKDLELAAHIGQTLLAKNRSVLEQNELLEEKLASALEEASQLRHEVTRKDCLINLIAENERDDAGSSSPESDTNLQQFNRHVDSLQRRIRELEDENDVLHTKQTDLKDESCEMKLKEEHLISETIHQINYLKSEIQGANDQIRSVTDELSRRNDEALLQQENIRILIEEMKYLQERHSSLSEKHEELQKSLTSAYTSQFRLTQEVETLEEKYREVLLLLDDGFPTLHSIKRNIPFEVSLASELQQAESSSLMTSQLKTEEIFCRKKTSKVFETTKLVNERLATMTSSSSVSSIDLQRPDSVPLSSTPLRNNFIMTSPSLASGILSPPLGRPGIPGTNDLDVAVKKLNLIKTRISLISLLAQKINLRPKFERRRKKEDEKLKMRKNQSAPRLRAIKTMKDSATLTIWKKLASTPRGLSRGFHDEIFPASSSIVTRSRSLNVRCYINSDVAMMSPTPNHVNIVTSSCHDVTTTSNHDVTTPRKKNNINVRSPLDGTTEKKNDVTKRKATFILEEIDDDPILQSPIDAFQQLSLEKKTMKLRMNKSSPQLVGLAAALMPVSDLPSSSSLVLRGSPTFRMMRTSTSQTSLLRDLHGRNLQL